jgi:FtsP/CotA-like multicopper oxidase with cupredoxin domain
MGVMEPEYTDPMQAYQTTYPMYLSPEDDLRPWKHPKTPVLHTLGECGTNNAPVIEVPEGASTIELVLNNVAPTAHVLHMHGMKFKVLNFGNISEGWCSTAHFECFFLPWKVGQTHCPGDIRHGDPDNPGMVNGLHWGCAYNAEKDQSNQYDLDKLMEKDMISIWRRSWAVIRVPNVNPGFWTFHCHMEQHIPTGQMMVLGLKKSEIPAIPAGVPREGPCPVFSDDVETSV